MDNMVKSLFNAMEKLEKIDPDVFACQGCEINLTNNQIILFLTIRDQFNQIFIHEGRGNSIQDAVQGALDLYYKSLNQSTSKLKSLRLDIIKDIRPVKKGRALIDIRNDQVLYKNGIDGLAFGKNLDVIFLPEEVIMFKLIEEQQIQIFNLLDAIEKHAYFPSAKKFIKNFKKSSKLEAYKINLDTYYTNGKEVKTLYRGHRYVPTLSEDMLIEAITLTTNNYFTKVINSKGKFIYSYIPWENRKEKRYNILRHAGTVYSILEAYELTAEEKLLRAAESAVAYLSSKIISFQLNGKDFNAVVERDIIKLGGNALAIIALSKHSQVTGSLKYLSLMQGLARWITETQDDEGQFTIHKINNSTGEILNFTSHYYPGEAILALMRLYHIDGNEVWLDAAERAAHYLINVRDKGADIYSIAHDHWLLYALNELYRERSHDVYVDHVLLIAKSIMETQVINDDKNPDWNGAYYLPLPRLESTPTAIRSEGLSAAYHLAKYTGHEKEASRIVKAIHEGIRFQLQTQLSSETVFFYKKKKLCLGAFQRGLAQYDLRIDYTQHNISSLIAYYKIIISS